MASLLNMSGGSLLNKGLPYDAEIEYLESTGTQYIDTGIIAYKGLETTIDFQYISLASNQALFGLWNTSPRVIYNVTLYNRRWYFGSYCSSEANVSWLNNVVDTERHTISIDGNGSISQDGVLLTTQSSVSNDDNDISVYVFARNLDIQRVPSNIRCYSFKMKDNDTSIFDAIPVRIGNVGYLYDKVSGQLFGNAGTGDFILGPDK